MMIGIGSRWDETAAEQATAHRSPWGRGARSEGLNGAGREGQSASLLAPDGSPLVDQFYVILECRDEKHQVELLKRFTAEGFKCKAALA
jgi:hypothetical protein